MSLRPPKPNPTVDAAAALRSGWNDLLRRDPTPDVFAQKWLALLCAAVYGGGRLARPSADGKLAHIATHNVPELALDEAAHSRRIAETYAAGRPQIVPLAAATIVFAPLALDGELRGVIELFLPSGASPESQHQAIQLAGAACGPFAEYERRRRQRELQKRQTLVDEVERFTRSVHEKLSVRHTAYVAANDGRRLIGCDRLTVLLRRGRRYDVAAVSGVDEIETRSQASKLLGRLAAVVAATGEPIYFDGRNEELSPQLRAALNRYLDETHLREVAILPLAPPVTEADANDTAKRPPQKRPQPLGAIVVEQVENVTPAEGRAERAAFVAQHTTLALSKALEHETIPLLPLWKLCSGVGRYFAPGTRAKTWAAVGLVAAVAATLKFVPADFVLHAPGVLQPCGRHHVFAPLDATVKAIHVRHGDRVAAGQLLVELRNTDLDVSLADVTGKRTAAYEQLLAVERSLYEDSSQIGIEERHRLAGRRSEFKQQIHSFDEQLRLLRMKREALRIVSPIAGEITTWDVEQLLRDRPIRQGQILLDIADVAGPWELELQVPEDGIAQLLAAQAEQGPALRVSYRLAAEPRNDRAAEVREVHYAAEIRGEQGNTVLAKATLTGDSLPALRPGAEATAKVYCGRRALGYVWLHDAVDFVRTNIWFRLY